MEFNGATSKLPTPSFKRPALSVFNGDGQNNEIKRSRLNLQSQFSKKSNLRRSQSVTSLQVETAVVRNENAFKKPVGTVRAGTRLTKAPSISSLNEKSNGPSRGVVSAATTKTGKRPAWDLKGRVEDTENAMKKMQEQNANQISVITTLTQQMNSLQESLKQEKQVAETKSSDCQNLSSELQFLKAQINQKGQQIHELETSNESLKTQVLLKDEQITHLQKANIHLTSENSMLKSHIDVAKAEISNNVFSIKSLNETIGNLEIELQKTRNKLSESEEKVREAETIRRKLHNDVQELKGNIRVFCRIRPIPGDRKSNSVVVSAKNQQLILSHSSINNKLKTVEFAYDKVFDHTASQGEVFEEISQLVQSSLDGYNVCIFAYGQTGSGKTFTMEGTSKNIGMISRAVHQIFNTIECLKPKGWQYTLNATYLEVYNETIRDLLAKERDSAAHEIKMIEGSTEVYVTNLNVMEITTEQQIESILKTAHKHRVVASTMCNDRSSRSHSVFQLKLDGVNSTTKESCHGTLNLVDLAGSERLKESQSEGERLKETQSINKSLSNLGNVIMALSQKGHVPYRNSKLTHLLSNCLGGRSKTLMFVTVSPEEEQFAETINSLRFATKVNNCQIGTAVKKTK